VTQSHSYRPNKPKTARVSKTILIIVGILFPLCAIELAAHLLPNLIPPEIKVVFQNEQTQALKGLMSDEQLGYKYRPQLTDFAVPFENDQGQGVYTISTTSLGYSDVGFRDDGLTAEADTLVIGDSYASCASVAMPECWVELLEKAHQKDYANLGVVGYCPQQELGMLTKYGLPLRPKRVVWVFFANDLDDAWRFDQFGTGGFKGGKFWQNPVKAWLAQNSALYTLGAFFWFNRYLFYNLATADGTTVPRDSNMVWWLTHTDLAIPEVAEGLALTQQTILIASQQTQAAQAEFVVIILPFREQIYAPANLQPQLDQVNHTLLDFCRQNNLTCIDLLATLRERARQEPESIYFRKDIHLNARGNQLVAEAVGPQLLAQ
jgi:hypothetical protein